MAVTLRMIRLIQLLYIVECSIDLLKDLAMCCEKGNEMQMLISKFEKMYNEDKVASLKQKDIVHCALNINILTSLIDLYQLPIH